VEHLHYRFAGGRKRHVAQPRIVGVVASGNLEVLIEPAALKGECTIDIDTAANGFAAVWQAVIADFFARHALADVRISINDNGATPAIVALRLDQAVEEYTARSAEESA